MPEVFQLRCIFLLFSSATTTTTTATSPTTTHKNNFTLLTKTTTAKDDDKNMLVGYLAAGIAVLIVIGMSNLYSFLIATFKCFYGNLWYKKKPLSCWK